MKSKWMVAALVLLVSLPAIAQAQEPPRRPGGRVRVEPRAFSFVFNRGRIGVVVKTEADPETDRLGARIEAVTTGGPAEKAGLRAGDIITRFNGVSLAGADAEDEDRSGPGLKLVRLAQALDPGDTVRVEYKRANDTRTATLVAEDVETAWNFKTPVPGTDFMIDPDIRLRMFDGDEPGFAWAFGHAWAQLDLVSLNPDLAEYFGTQEGVLVVRAPEGESLALKGGDVILAIDGRKPSSPAHAMRILRSYDEGETVKIDIMRKQKRMTVNWTVPDREGQIRRSPRRAPEGERT